MDSASSKVLLTPDPELLADIRNYPEPKNLKQLSSFHGHVQCTTSLKVEPRYSPAAGRDTSPPKETCLTTTTLGYFEFLNGRTQKSYRQHFGFVLPSSEHPWLLEDAVVHFLV